MTQRPMRWLAEHIATIGARLDESRKTQPSSSLPGPIALNILFVTVLLAGAAADRPFTVPKSAAAKYGHGLTRDLAMDGWISLFDGKTTFGWEDGSVSEGTLTKGRSTGLFADAELRAEVVAAGEIVFGGRRFEVRPGAWTKQVRHEFKARVSLNKGAAVRTLLLKPTRLEPIFNHRDLSGWTVIRHPRLPAERQAKWRVENESIHANGGPGALEYDRQYGDCLLQAKICTKARLVIGGIFFRSVPHDFLNGYEVQIFNACYDEDAEQPARYSTSTIYRAGVTIAIPALKSSSVCALAVTGKNSSGRTT